MKVYVLVAAHGEDPPEATVIAAYSTAEAANARRAAINDMACAHWGRVCQATSCLQAEWRAWLDAVAARRSRPWSSNWLPQMKSLEHQVGSFSFMSGLVQHLLPRSKFVSDAVSVAGDGPAPPELPATIEWGGEHFFTDYQMTVQEVEYQP